jgi:hypothetical protein
VSGGRDIYREIHVEEGRSGLQCDLLENLTAFFDLRIGWARARAEDRTAATCAAVLEMRRVMAALAGAYPEFGDTVAKLDAGCDKLLAACKQSLLKDFLSPTTPAEELAPIAETLAEIISRGLWQSWSFDFDLEVERRCQSPSAA